MSKKEKKEKEVNKKTEKKQSSVFLGIKNFFNDDRFKVSFGLFLLALAMYIALSLISYLFTWKSDQSILTMSSIELFSNNTMQVENWMGKLGAIISNLLIHDSFGLSSFIFVSIISVFGFNLLNIKFVKLSRFLFLSLIFCTWLSIALASIFTDKYFYVGGSYGFYIFSWLEAIIGKIGAFTAIALTGIIIIFYSFSQSLQNIKNLFSKVKNIKKENFIDNIDTDPIISSTNSTDNIEQISEEEAVTEETNNTIDLTQSQPITEDIVSNLTEEDDDEKDTSKKIEIFSNFKEDIPLEINTSQNTQQTDNNEDDLSTDDISSLDYADINEDFQVYDPTRDLEYYVMPSIELLEDKPTKRCEIDREELNANKDRIVKTLSDYKIDIDKISATIGPTVTLYEIVPAAGVRIAKIKNLEDDIALSLSALGIRIIAPIPGKGTIGIEIPNSKPEIVSMRSVLQSAAFQESKYELPVAIGKTISNETYIFNLAKSPHLLVAGATGQGKSVGVNAIITSLLYKLHPAQLKFVFVDPKMVELSIYREIEKHYLAKLPNEDNPIVTDVSKVVPVMNSLCIEMDKRYTLLTDAGVRNIVEYNIKFINRKLNPQKGHYYMPYIVVIIDEFADIIVQEGKQVETPISRLAAKARAIGIHLIVATQRPSTDVITGVIKANFPARIAFKVTNIHDSKTILDSTGANQLIGRGDMLISESGKISRVQCAFIDTPEVEVVVNYIKKQQAFPIVYELPEPDTNEGQNNSSNIDSNVKDELFEEAARIIVRHQQGSTSLIQRKLSIGYNRAGRIIDQLENARIVGPFEGSKARQVYFADEISLEQYLNNIP